MKATKIEVIEVVSQMGKISNPHSELHIMSPDTQKIIKHISELRDTACIALRESHITKKFEDN